MSHPTRIAITIRMLDLIHRIEHNPLITKKEREEALAELDKLKEERNLLDVTLNRKK